MDIVVDTSVIMAVITNEPEKDALIEVTRGVDLIAPPSVHWETGCKVWIHLLCDIFLQLGIY